MSSFIERPLSAYESEYADAVRTKSEEFFNSSVAEAKIDEEANKKTVAEYYKKQKLLSKVVSIKKAQLGFGWFFIIATVIAALVAYAVEEYRLYAIIVAVPCLAFAIFLFVKASKNGKFKKELEAEKNKLYNEATAQIAPLLEKLPYSVPYDIISSVLPNVKMDHWFSRDKHKMMSSNFDLASAFNENTTTLGIISGNISENPFIILRTYTQEIEDTTYTGSLDIAWETLESDYEGNLSTVRHTQTLYASTVHPEPVFEDLTYVFFGCEAAPELNFERVRSGVLGMTERQAEKQAKHNYKELKKVADKSLKTDNPLVLLANEEFEGLFNCDIRNNDVQFRMLFTPLAQQNMVASIKDTKFFGDNFEISKEGKNTMVFTDQLKDFNFYTGNRRYYSFDLDLMRKTFISFMCSFFKDIYFSIAPILNIPVYQQTKNPNFMEINSDAHYSVLEAEVYGNSVCKVPHSATPIIVKATPIDGIKFKFDSYGFKTISRTDYVSVRGDDGYLHDVPVPWVEYIKVSSSEILET